MTGTFGGMQNLARRTAVATVRCSAAADLTQSQRWVRSPGLQLLSIKFAITQRRGRSDGRALRRDSWDEADLESARTCLRRAAKKYKIDEDYLGGHFHRPQITSFYATEPQFPGIDLEPVRPYPDNKLASTRPAPLDPPTYPDPEEGQSQVSISARVQYYYRLGRSYLTFYKTGLKNVWTNRKEVRTIRRRILDAQNSRQTRSDDGWGPMRQSLDGESVEVHHGPGEVRNDERTQSALTRREYHLLRRTSRDIKSLVPFALVLSIFGEFTPLVIILLPSSLLPGTCHLEKQIRYDFERPFRILERYCRRSDELMNKSILFGSRRLPNAEAVEQVDRPRTSLNAYRVGVSPFSSYPPVFGLLWLRWWAFPRLCDYWTEVFEDMILVRREGGYSRLEPAEVVRCVLKYQNQGGLIVLKRELDDTNGLPDFDSEDLKDELVPMLENQVDQAFSYDFTRLPPWHYWQAAKG